MRSSDVRQAGYPTVDFVLGAIADWVNKYRNHIAGKDALGRCSPDEVNRIAKELGMSADELRGLADKSPGSAELIQKMLVALNVDPAEFAQDNPAVLRDLQRLCVACNHKTRCRHELAAGTAAAHFREYCPNAFTLEALFAHESLPFQH